MSFARKNSGKMFGSIAGIVVLTAIGVWQFYRFVTFTNGEGSPELQGGTLHLWLAIAMALFACIASFVVFSVFVRYDPEDDLHITSPPGSSKSKSYK